MYSGDAASAAEHDRAGTWKLLALPIAYQERNWDQQASYYNKSYSCGAQAIVAGGRLIGIRRRRSKNNCIPLAGGIASKERFGIKSIA
mmetsp:Transcript_16177/g.19388  ORF Transcript_16177/g.19388 Transcript_16177/m.19388 type:complete len:88 (+) Transcript_16177:379-642(+)